MLHQVIYDTIINILLLQDFHKMLNIIILEMVMVAEGIMTTMNQQVILYNNNYQIHYLFHELLI